MARPSFPTLHAVPRAVSILEGLSFDEVLARRDMITLTFDRRIRYRRGGGCWREWRAGLKTHLDLPWCVNLAIPPVAQWTGETVAQIVAIARAQLTARGAVGRCRITARVDSWYPVNVLTLGVRVGDLRTVIRIEAGTIRYAVPLDVVSTVADLAPSRDLTGAVKQARSRNR